MISSSLILLHVTFIYDTNTHKIHTHTHVIVYSVNRIAINKFNLLARHCSAVLHTLTQHDTIQISTNNGKADVIPPIRRYIFCADFIKREMQTKQLNNEQSKRVQSMVATVWYLLLTALCACKRFVCIPNRSMSIQLLLDLIWFTLENTRNGKLPKRAYEWSREFRAIFIWNQFMYEELEGQKRTKKREKKIKRKCEMRHEKRKFMANYYCI